MKSKLTYFLRNLSPILKQALTVAQDYVPSIERLQDSLQSAQLKYNLHLTLQKQTTESQLIEEKDAFNFFTKMKNLLSFAINQIMPQPSDQHFDLYLNRAMFHGNQANNYSHLVFQSFMDD